MNLYLNHNSDQKTSPEYTLKLQNQYKTTFFFPTVTSLRHYVITSLLLYTEKLSLVFV